MTDTTTNQNQEAPKEAMTQAPKDADKPQKPSAVDRVLETVLDAMEAIGKGARKTWKGIGRAFTAARAKAAGGAPPPPPPPHGPDEPRRQEPPDDLMKSFQRGVKILSKAFGRALLAATVLTGFAEKKTQEPAEGDKEPPKAVLNVGTLGVTVAKVKINNGDKTTDFDANMPLAKAAKEAVGKVVPQEEQDQLFEDNPIEKGVIEDIASKVLNPKAEKNSKETDEVETKEPEHKDNKTLLKEGSDPQTKAGTVKSKNGQKYAGPVRNPRDDGRS